MKLTWHTDVYNVQSKASGTASFTLDRKALLSAYVTGRKEEFYVYVTRSRGAERWCLMPTVKAVARLSEDSYSLLLPMYSVSVCFEADVSRNYSSGRAAGWKVLCKGVDEEDEYVYFVNGIRSACWDIAHNYKAPWASFQTHWWVLTTEWECLETQTLFSLEVHIGILGMDLQDDF